jgi:intracellular septation protein
MKLFFDFLPGLFFLGALFLFDIYTATAVVMAAMGVQILLMLALKKKISGVQWFTFGIVLIFGSATLLLHDATFIKWKPTVINWMFAAMLLLGPVILKKNFIRVLMSEHMTLPDRVWAKLNLGWAGLLLLLGALNLVIAYNFSERVWGLYKVFGMTGLMVLFIIAQTLWISRYLPEDGTSKS